jgi:hypothetical protein
LAQQNEQYPTTTGAASWWLLLALVLVASAGFYIYYQQRQITDPRPSTIRVAQADSSGALPPIDTTRPSTTSGNGTRLPFPESTPAGPYIAPSPGFESSRSGPVGNLLGYARSLRFDAERGMEFELPVNEYGQRHRVVRLEPLMNLRLLDSAAFAEGRILARIRSDAALPALGLHSGENFVWVQGLQGAPLQAEVWPASVLTPPRTIQLTYSSRPPTNAPDGKDAFWLGPDDRRVLWIACGRGWCHS